MKFNGLHCSSSPKTDEIGGQNGDVQLLAELDVVIHVLFRERVFVPAVV
jgi:hypothetical protein